MCFVFFFFKQKTAYEMRISDWSSDVCSSDLRSRAAGYRKGRCWRECEMLGTSLLNNVTLPESFEYRVEGRIETPLAIVELHQYHFRQPQQALFDSPRGFLDLALTQDRKSTRLNSSH